jgi:hypothetical protein
MLVLSASFIACAGYGTAVHTHKRGGNYVLHVPASRLQVIIPKNGFVQKDPRQVGGPDTPGYFYFEDSTNNIIISGWFSPEKAFPGTLQLWEKDTKAWEKKGLPTPLDVAFEKTGSWDAILYDLQKPNHTNSHLRAQWVQAGTWIDLHLSITIKDSSSAARHILREVLKVIRVEKY